MVTRRGAAGVCVASLVTEELRLALVHAPIPRQHMEGMTAVDWDELHKQEYATHTSVQVRILVQHTIYHVIRRSWRLKHLCSEKSSSERSLCAGGYAT